MGFGTKVCKGVEVKTLDKNSGLYVRWYVDSVLSNGELVVYPKGDNKENRRTCLSPRDCFTGENGKVFPCDPSVDPAKFIPRDEVQRPVRFKRKALALRMYTNSGYPSAKRTHCSSKEECNEVFVRAALTHKDGFVVFLDTPSFTSFRMLVQNEVCFARLACPQFDKDEYEAMKPWLHVRHESMSEHLQRYQPGDISAIWLDYCGHWRGNGSKDIYPRSDVIQLLKKDLVRDGGSVFLTVSKQHMSEDTARQDIDDIQAMFRNGWVCENESAYQNILFFGFKKK